CASCCRRPAFGRKSCGSCLPKRSVTESLLVRAQVLGECVGALGTNADEKPIDLSTLRARGDEQRTVAAPDDVSGSRIEQPCADRGNLVVANPVQLPRRASNEAAVECHFVSV